MPKTFQFLKLQGGKALAALLATIFIGLATVGGTVAYLIAKTNVLTNLFTPAELKIEVSADVSSVTNTGDAEVFVRVALVPSWKSNSETNTILATAPSVAVELPTNWIQVGDFYYYQLPLEAGDSVAVPTVVLQNAAPSGYTFSLEVLADAIQAAPSDAAEENWVGVDVVDGKLTVAQDS